MSAAPDEPSVTGLVLAAGAGRRMGKPKATVIGTDGVPWIVRTVRSVLAGGCDRVLVVLGSGHERARELLAQVRPGAPDGGLVRVVVAQRWTEGMGESLRAGLEAVLADADAESRPPAAVLVQLVDLPDVGADVIGRVTRVAGPSVLARAAYQGVPGHPVLIGVDHLGPLAATLSGDVGAKHYLASRDVRIVECGDLAGGADVDHRFEN
ncbi:nucleotidyltransferase family protein [Spelaeicoccus albus]|uniref:CTP:molybdopterin cytidylyltransferase MocA n=1 Tax=Spelaeicoccus albus TaxID=1280376 RepID=A0A7Z0A7I3_9MICO|nr:nucleotidyltransferase family protein [Spelaeicoccus albus]NYI65837.1 CTP:molybdopterin cytidylyltransferase MocA [Spelaeicoccus albus]